MSETEKQANDHEIMKQLQKMKDEQLLGARECAEQIRAEIAFWHALMTGNDPFEGNKRVQHFIEVIIDSAISKAVAAANEEAAVIVDRLANAYEYNATMIPGYTRSMKRNAQTICDDYRQTAREIRELMSKKEGERP